ncbi:MAG: hypothetical protein DHS20C21_14510 [Gemmatimonadota bacterium]|nr:MAG: hypothetical protein DHS20C21_14510 [Gemmatimonadota bacterium]
MNRTIRVERERSDQRGMALISLLVILAALTVLSMGLMVFSSTEVRIADNQRNHTDALYVTESGIEEVVARMQLAPGTNVTVNGSTFDASIRDDPTAPDPNWRAEVYLTDAGSLPAPGGTETILATVQPNGAWLQYGDAANGMDPIVVEHKWVDLNADGLRTTDELVRYDANRFPPENFVSGQLVEVITATGLSNGSQRQIRQEVIRTPLTVNVLAAITCDNGVDLTGNMTGCGHNHDIATPVGTKIPACYPWELCNFRSLDATARCLVGVMTTGDDASTGGSSDLEGFPAWADTSSSNTFFDVHEYLGLTLAQWNEIRNNPDYTSANDAANMNGIVVVEGDATSGEKFNGNTGTGLIYVNGDMDIGGNFQWRGLIYVEGDCKIVGTGWLLGAMIVRGSTTDAFAAGNSTILFSQEAISTYVGMNLGYQTLAWSEQ